MRVTVVGSLNLDYTFHTTHLPNAGETLQISEKLLSPGGKGANQAVSAARLGAEVNIVGAVGKDPAGQYILEKVAAQGVDVSAVLRHAEPTGEAFILVDDSGENFIVVHGGANLGLDAAWVTKNLRDTNIILCGFEVTDEVVEAAAKAAIQLDALFIFNPSPYRNITNIVFNAKTIMVVNEYEYSQVRAAIDADGRFNSLVGIIVTKGSAGATVLEPATGRVQDVQAMQVVAVDTSGCGDAFTGALAAALARGDTLVDATRFGVRVGSYAATKRGTQNSYPTLIELLETTPS